MNIKPELAIVIPVYNEENNIGILIRQFHELLVTHNINGRFYIINDGSTDNSKDVIEDIALHIPCIELINKENSGHGPSIYIGYQLSAKHDWVFQIDSDNQYDLAAFPELWNHRNDFDILLAERQERNASAGRSIITFFTTTLVKLFFGGSVKDINTPFRLMRTSKLSPALKMIAPNSFAPNVLITANFIKEKHRFYTLPVTLAGKDARTSKAGSYILKGVMRSFADLFLLRFNNR